MSLNRDQRQIYQALGLKDKLPTESISPVRPYLGYQ
jgi:hypothetical protein